MFCVAGLDQSPTTASFKVNDKAFEDIISRDGFTPAPYVGKYKWVLASDITWMNKKQWQKYLDQSYQLVKDNLVPKIKKQLELT